MNIMKRTLYTVAFAVTALFAAYTQSCNSQEQSGSADTDPQLKAMRTQIDSLDNQLIEILAARMKVCVAVGQYKKEHNIAVVQSNRYNEIVERLTKQGKDLGLSEDFVKKIMDTIHEESVRQQNELVGQ